MHVTPICEYIQAFQRITEAFETLNDPVKRRDYNDGKDVKSNRDDERDSEDSDAEENKTSLREEVERKYFPERYKFLPFGDPFIEKRKREKRKQQRAGRPSWYDEF